MEKKNFFMSKNIAKNKKDSNFEGIEDVDGSKKSKN